jgi:hypothetical protein
MLCGQRDCTNQAVPYWGCPTATASTAAGCTSTGSSPGSGQA